MSTLSLRRSVIVLGVATLAVPAFGTLLATPAAAFCLLRCGGFGFHLGPSPMLLRRPIAPSVALPATSGMARPHIAHHIASVPDFHPKNASPKSSSPSTSSPKTSSSGGTQLRHMLFPKQTTDVSPGGPSSVGSAGGANFGGFSGLNQSGGNVTSGLAPNPPASSGSGSGEYSAASVPANASSGPIRSLNDPAATNRSSARGSAVTRSLPAANAAPTATLTAVTVCMTRAGSCPMDREVGTACQCKDTQGNVYDGVVK